MGVPTPDRGNHSNRLACKERRGNIHEILQMKKNPSSVTLIELVIVITILAILAPWPCLNSFHFRRMPGRLKCTRPLPRSKMPPPWPMPSCWRGLCRKRDHSRCLSTIVIEERRWLVNGYRPPRSPKLRHLSTDYYVPPVTGGAQIIAADITKRHRGQPGLYHNL